MNGELIAVLHGHAGGVTHIRFSSDGNRLYSGARKVNGDDERKDEVKLDLVGRNASLLGYAKSRRIIMHISTACSYQSTDLFRYRFVSSMLHSIILPILLIQFIHNACHWKFQWSYHWMGFK